MKILLTILRIPSILIQILLKLFRREQKVCSVAQEYNLIYEKKIK